LGSETIDQEGSGYIQAVAKKVRVFVSGPIYVQGQRPNPYSSFNLGLQMAGKVDRRTVS
jgi:hypothetical protein